MTVTPYHNTIAIKGLKIRRQKSLKDKKKFISFLVFSHCVRLFRLHGIYIYSIPTITKKLVKIDNPLLSTCKQGLVFALQNI